MSIVEPIVSKISKVAHTIAFRHIGYLFQYNENIHNLEVETQGLEDILSGINEMVVSAERNAEVIQPYVEKWQKAAKEMQDEVATFIEKKVRSNSWCIKCWCPNPMWRYRLGKESKLKTSRVISLKEQGTKCLPVLPLSRPAPPPEHPLTSHDAFDSRQEILKGIMEALKDPTINMIGMYGAGGVGKTTMVKEVANLAKKSGLFDDVAFAVVSRNLDMKNVQGELAAKLGLNLDDHGRADKLLTRLQNGKKNLVILDDVWYRLNLEDIGIPTTTDHGNKEGCCKVLITSRKQLLHMMTRKPADQSTSGVSISAPVASTKEFYIPILEKKEAWSLFMKTAEISINSNEETLSDAKKVCNECGGLPVAILAVATALKGKEWYAWRNALALLRNSNFDQIVDIDPNLFSSLKLSYDSLESRDARSCFLLCSLFPEDAEISIEDLVIYCFGMRLLDRITALENVRDRVLTLVKGLKESCLLLQGRDDNTVKMHDVIRDVAILIAKGEKGYLVNHDLKKWPEEGTFEGHSVISLKFEYFSEIPSELGSQEFHTLVLRSKDSSLPDNFFNGMETSLEVLDLSGMAIERLPFSLSKLVKLRMLLLPDEVSDVSLLGGLKSLEILRVNGIKKLTPDIRQLTGLKFLDLGYHGTLRGISPNVISNLKRLEELCIQDSFNGWEDEAINTEGMNATDTEGRNASLVELNSLTYLTALKVHIPRGKSSPNNLCFEKLVRFRISIGAPFDPNDKEEIPSTKTLKLEDVPLEDKFKVLLVKSEVVYVTKVKGLENVFHERDGSGFFNLKYLEVTRCDGGENLLGRPEPSLQTSGQAMSRSFCNLTKLRVAHYSFKYLFSLSVARRLEQLQVLSVETCSCMEVIVGNERQGDDEEIIFPRLREMTLMDLPNLISFCPSKMPNSITEASNSDPAQPLFREKVVVPALEELTIAGLDNISEVWDKQFKPIVTEGIGSFGQLLSLDVGSCRRLVNVVPSNMLQRLRNLEFLLIRQCESVVCDIENLTVVLPRLKRLYLEDLPNLRETGLNKKEDSLHGINVVYPNITNITIANCPNLESIFSSSTARKLTHLRHLYIISGSSDSKLKAIVETSEERDGANDDELFVFPELSAMYLIGMANLQSFCSSCGDEESLFNQKVTFPRLENLELDGCESLRCIFQPSIARILVSLQELIIHDCSKMEAVVGGEEEIEDGQGRKSTDKTLFPHLSKLELRRLPELRWFCHFRYPLELPLLSKMVIESCPKLNSFSSGSVSSSDHAQMALFNDKVILPVLEDLLVLALDRIDEIWDKQSPLVNQETVSFGQLKNMTVRSCRKLTNLFPSTILPRLQNLQTLLVDGCPNVEFVVFKNEKGEEQAADDSTLIIPQLRHLRIWNMEKLKSFYSSTTTSNATSLFNHQVTFPRLENLKLDGCESFRCVFQLSMARVLVNLQQLIIHDCSKMEAVVDGEEEIEDGQGRKSTDKTLFPLLSKLEIRRLPELRRFCQFRYPLEMPLLSQMVIEVCPRLNSFSSGSVSSSAQAQMVLFHDKVILPVLERLTVVALDSIEEIWDKQSPFSVTFPRLENLKLDGCESLRCVFQLSMSRVLVNLQQLIIHDCSKMEAVVDGEEEIEDGQGRKSTDKTLFPHLSKLEIRRLPELRRFCQFRYPLEMPLLSQMVIEVCPRLNSFSSGSVSSSAQAQMVLFHDKVTFPRLENLELDGCDSLRYIFQPSMARVLVNLQELIINDCSKIEAVVGGEEEIEDRQGRNSIDKTQFPHLSKLELRRLPKLRRFCHFSDPLELPLLSQIVMWDCPSMDLSSLGSVSPPNLSLEGPSFSPDHRSGRDAPPGPEFPSIMDCEDFHSRHKVFKAIVEALKDPEVNMIGVYGTGGVGKTTMVDKVGKLVKKDGIFDEVIKAVVSYDASVREIQGHLADGLNLMLHSETEQGRARQLWNRFDTGKNILIILDDVWQELDFSEIGIPITGLNKRCKVVITSRNRYVLKKMDVHKDFKIEFLSEVEAWTLFKKEVGNYVDSHDQQLHDIAQAVCKYSEGFPVAINALGAALRGKDMYAWQDALNKLKKSMLWDIEGINKKVYGSLRRNYDRLDSEDAKSCFLLCCLFSENAEIPIDGLVRYYMAGGTIRHDQKPDTLKRALYQVRTLVNTLKSQCLLLDGNSEDTVKMHTVMRHVSTSIANDDKSFFVEHLVKDWPEKVAYEHCSVISLRPDYMREFPNELDCPMLHTLRLDCTGNKFHVQVPDKFFSGTENLTILDLKSVTILPASLAKLAKLQMLCLNGCNLLGDIAILKDLKDHLEILSLRGSNIKVLPPEVGELTRLRLLDMADCKELRMIPKGVTSNLLSLEELYMPWSFRQWEGTTQQKISCVSLDELMSLTELTTLHFHVPDTTLLPTKFTFGKLDRYRISIGGEGLIGNWGQGDRALVLENIHIANALEYFVGKGKWIMQRIGLYLPTSFNHLTNLSVRDCRLKYLFSPLCAKGLDQLQYLTVESCTVTEGVIGIEGEKDEDIVIIFRKLKYLSLDGLPNLISFYPREKKTAKNSGSSSAHSQMVLFNDKVIFSVLERLTISKVGNIIEIFDKQSIAVIKEQGSFCRLMYLDVKECDNLMHVFPSKMCPMLMNPHELDVRNCGSMEGIIEFEGELDKDGLEHEVRFSKLRRMKLQSLPKLISICTKLGKAGTTAGNSTICAQPFFAEKVTFPWLENLELEGCGSLTYIFQPSMARDLVNLQELIINDCSKMKAVLDGEEEIDGQGRKSTHKTLFLYLIKLELRHLPELRRFCHFRYPVPVELPLLSQMKIEDCPRMNSFSSESVSTPNLFARFVSYDFVGDDTTVTEEEEPSKNG